MKENQLTANWWKPVKRQYLPLALKPLLSHGGLNSILLLSIFRTTGWCRFFNTYEDTRVMVNSAC